MQVLLAERIFEDSLRGRSQKKKREEQLKDTRMRGFRHTALPRSRYTVIAMMPFIGGNTGRSQRKVVSGGGGARFHDSVLFFWLERDFSV
jgi:hypothetical protein